MSPAERYQHMTQDERLDLLRRFNLFCSNGNDNRIPHITFDEAELLCWLAARADG